MTTIITKNGSGAPTAGQLSQGELAVDLTNKELYTKDSGGNVIKVGAQGGSTGTFTDLTATSSFTSPGIDDNATSTAITIDTNENVGIGTDSPTAVGTKATLHISDDTDGGALRLGDATTNAFLDCDTATGTRLRANAGELLVGTNAAEDVNIVTASQPRVTVDSSGNVGIGTNEPNDPLHVAATGQDCEVTIQAISAGAFDARLRLNGGSSGFSQINFGSELDSNNGFIQYDNSNKYMAFRANDVERMRIDSSGNVGIGTTNPQLSLDVARDAGSATTGDYLGIDVDAVTTGSPTTLASGIRFKVDGVAGARISSTAAKDLVFKTNNSAEAMRIDSTGKVGIGETDPVTALHINQGSVSTAPAPLDRQVARLERTGACFLGLLAGNVAQMGIDFGSTTDVDAGSFRFDNNSDSFAWRIADDEKMRINSAGDLLVGTTTSSARLTVRSLNSSSSSLAINTVNGIGTGLFYIRNDGAFNTGGAVNSPYFNTTASAANVNVSASGFLARSTSSARYKENIRDYDQPASIDALRPVFFNSINEGDDKDYAGFIAEEVHEAGFTEFVEYNTDGEPDAVFYANMVALLVKEIQDLKVEVAALKGA